ncbi:MAG: hypothetical protein V1923_06325 [Candidatus Omnitrophota bacterium]
MADETLEIQSDKVLMRRIRKAEKDIRSKKGAPLEKIRKKLLSNNS